ncbi:hypothetical protein ACFCZ1_31525 [Streptomyces sp. NPDC056224]
MVRLRRSAGRGRHETIRRDTSRHECHVTIETGINQITGDLTKWPAAQAT